MSLISAVGFSQSPDAREAALQATHQALDLVGNAPVGLGLVFASSEFQIQAVLTGVSTLLGNAPLAGFSTTLPLANQAYRPRSVVVALLAGSEARAQTVLLTDFARESQAAAKRLAQTAEDIKGAQGLLLFGDGFAGDLRLVSQALPSGLSVTGCLSSGQIHLGRSYQIGGAQAASGALAAAFLQGGLRFASASGSGWEPVGPYFKVTQTREGRLVELDGQPVHQVYSSLFGHEPEEWLLPPLNDIIRLYPLGIERQGQSEMDLVSAIQVEPDGSLKVNAPVLEGDIVHLMVGTPQACLQAAEQAAQQALQRLGSARPVLALILADLAWQYMMEPQSYPELQAIRNCLTPEVPVAGGLTLGQLVQNDGEAARLQNQHLQVILIGQASE